MLSEVQVNCHILPPLPVTSTRNSSNGSSIGLSPGRLAELRMKNIQQLRELQRLYEENVLTLEEFAGQKRIVLETLRKLTSTCTQ